MQKKMSSDLFEDDIYKMCLEVTYFMYICKKDLALNNLQWLIYHKTQSMNQYHINVCKQIIMTDW